MHMTAHLPLASNGLKGNQTANLPDTVTGAVRYHQPEVLVRFPVDVRHGDDKCLQRCLFMVTNQSASN